MNKFKLTALSLLMAFGLGLSVAAYAYPDPILKGWDNKSKFAQQVAGAGGTTQVTTLKWVRHSSQGPNIAGIASGDVVVYDTVSDDGISVRLTTTSADGAIAGIAVTAIPSSDNATGSTGTAFDDYGRRNWGWILVHGRIIAKTSAGGTNGNSIGDAFITSTDSGAITSLISFDTSTVAQNLNRAAKASQASGGFFYDTSDGTSTTYDVQVNLE